MSGAKPLGKVKISWSQDFAYAIGLITTDGNLSPDGRHINFTSKDYELVKKFKQCLVLDNKIGRKYNAWNQPSRVVQFGDVLFYKFLLGIGLKPNKSKILKGIVVPDKYFFDFLRGHFDGDGTFYSYWDPRWRSSYMFYTVFVSASRPHILWLQAKIQDFLCISGHITKAKTDSCYQLKYAKKDSLKLLKKMYYADDIMCLSRKRLKIKRALVIIGLSL